MAISKEELQKILEASQKKSQKAQSAPIKEAKPIEQIEKNLFKNASKVAKEQQLPSKKRKAKRVAAIVGAGIMATSVAAAAVVVPVVIYQEHKSFLLEVIPGGESGAKLEPLTVHPGTTAKELPDIVVPGYKFRGYFSDKNCTKALNPSLEITKEMTIYAKFVHEYDLTVYINGTKQIVKYYDDFTVGQAIKGAIDLNKEHFVGWYLNAECTEPLVEGEYLKEDTTIFAKYANTNNLTLVLNGEKIIISAYTDETLQQALQNAKVDTTGIKGWKDAKGNTVQLGSYITSAQTLYAEYENTKQVTVVINGKQTVVTALPGQTISDVLKLVDYETENLVGWYTDAEYKNKVTNLSTKITEDMHLYARYAEHDTLTLVVPGREDIQITVYDDESLAQVLENSSLTIENFVGWYLDKQLQNPVTIEALSQPITVDTTLYARCTNFENEKVQICVYNAQKEEYEAREEDVTFYEDETLQQVLQPIQEGLTNFIGWYTDANFEEPANLNDISINFANHQSGAQVCLYARCAETISITINSSGLEQTKEYYADSAVTVAGALGGCDYDAVFSENTYSNKIEDLTQKITNGATYYLSSELSVKVNGVSYTSDFYSGQTINHIINKQFSNKAGVEVYQGEYSAGAVTLDVNATIVNNGEYWVYFDAEVTFVYNNEPITVTCETYHTIKEALGQAKPDLTIGDNVKVYNNEQCQSENEVNLNAQFEQSATYYVTIDQTAFAVNDAGVSTLYYYEYNKTPTIEEVLSQNPVYAQKIAEGKACTVATTSSMASGSVVTDLTATAEPGVTYYFAYNVSPKYYHNGETITSEGWHSQNSIADFITGLKDVLQVSSLKLFSDDDYINEIENSETKITDATYHVSMPVELTLAGENLPDEAKTYTAYSHMTYAQAMQEIANYLHSTPKGKEGYYGGVVNYSHIDAGNVNSEEELNSHVGTVDGFFICVQTKFTIRLHVQQPDGSFKEEFGSGYYGEYPGEREIIYNILEKYGAEGWYYGKLNYDIYYSDNFTDENIYILGDEVFAANDYTQGDATYYARRYTKVNIEFAGGEFSLYQGEYKFYNDTENPSITDVIYNEFPGWSDFVDTLTITCNGNPFTGELTEYSNETISYYVEAIKTSVDVMVYDGTNWQKYTILEFSKWACMMMFDESWLPSVEDAGVDAWYEDENFTRKVVDSAKYTVVYDYFAGQTAIYGKKIQKVTFTIQGDQYNREEGVCVADIYSETDAYYAFVGPGEYDVYMKVQNGQKVVYDGEYDGAYVLQGGDVINFYGVAITESITVVVDGVSKAYDRDVNIDMYSFLQGEVGVPSWMIGVYTDSAYQNELDVGSYYTGTWNLGTIYIKTMYTVSYLSETALVVPGTDLIEIANEVLNSRPAGYFDYYICVNGERVDYASYKIYGDIDVSLEYVALTETITINYGSGTRTIERDLNVSLLGELKKAGFSSDTTSGLYLDEKMTIPVEECDWGESGYTTIYTRMATQATITYYEDPRTATSTNFTTHNIFTFTELADGSGYSVRVDLSLSSLTSLTEEDFPMYNVNYVQITWDQYLSSTFGYYSDIVIPETYNGKPVKQIANFDISYELCNGSIIIPKYIEFDQNSYMDEILKRIVFIHMGDFNTHNFTDHYFVGGRQMVVQCDFSYVDLEYNQLYDSYTYKSPIGTHFVTPADADIPNGALPSSLMGTPSDLIIEDLGSGYYDISINNCVMVSFNCPNV